VSDLIPATEPAELADIRAWWDNGGPEDESSFYRFTPIAGSPRDQVVPDGISNPYWEIIRQMPSVDDDLPWRNEGLTPHGYSRGLVESCSREKLVGKYAWAIPSPGDITWMTRVLDGRGLVEVGAGSGYWAWQAQQAGIDTIAYEPVHPDDNKYVDGHEWATVLRDGHEAAAHHPDRALLLCWPSYSEPWAAHTLATYNGDMLIYVGESEGGCCADDAFFELLDAEWEEAGRSPHHVTWWAIHCGMTAYRRIPR
jgi:hypothetical protein